MFFKLSSEAREVYARDIALLPRCSRFQQVLGAGAGRVAIRAGQGRVGQQVPVSPEGEKGDVAFSPFRL